jgi:hypothetical protein
LQQRHFEPGISLLERRLPARREIGPLPAQAIDRGRADPTASAAARTFAVAASWSKNSFSASSLQNQPLFFCRIKCPRGLDARREPACLFATHTAPTVCSLYVP